MKRKTEMIPEFDEIIFENRNKNYGAYNLRRQYKSAASLSIIGGITLTAILFSVLSFTTEKGTASPPPIDVILRLENPIVREIVPQQPVKAPASSANNIKNLKPVVTEDTSEVTHFTPTTEEILGTVQNGIPTDTMQVTVTPEPEIPVEPEIFTIVQEMPEYPGGVPALMKFINENLNYPQEAVQNNIQGKVILKFVVNTDGTAGRIEITRGIDPLLDNEAARVVKSLPKFKPGKQRGVPVLVWFVLPVTFKLENN